MRTLLLTLLIFFSLSAESQITFEKLYPFSAANSIEELPDHSFVGCADSSQQGLIFSIDKYGNLTSEFYPMLKGQSVSINGLVIDKNTNGFALCGNIGDLTGGDTTGYYLLLDQQLNNTDSVFYTGGINGPSGRNLARLSNNDFVVVTETWFGAGSYNVRANKVIYPGTADWSNIAGSNISFNGLAVDQADNILMATFGWTAAAAASIKKLDPAGNLLHTYGITDTAFGGSLIFQSCTAPVLNDEVMFGVAVDPSSLSYGVAYLAKLDTALNVIWDKYLDWGSSVSIIGMTSTSDSCIVLLMNTDNGLTLHKINSAGDSLWTQYHARPITGYGSRFKECSDGGFIIVGGFSDTISYGYILKTDSLGRLLPNATISVSGPNEFCQNDTATTISAQSGYVYQWSNGDTMQTIVPASTGNYFVTVTDSLGLSATSDSVSITVHVPVQPLITDNSDTLSSTIAVSYQWYLDSMIISGATSESFIALVNGLYLVEVVDSNGCTSISPVYVATTVSVDEQLENGFEAILYPNPASNKVSLLFKNANAGKMEIELINALGSRISIENFNLSNSEAMDYSIETTNLESGNYILRISDNKSIRYLKLFIVR